ncbi:MAG: prolipoprotein diacylglyceryl transferase family protein [Caulobacteraceae bacterium]
MIHIATAPWAHLIFDGLGWASATALGAMLYRWRLKQTAEHVALATGPGYAAALGVGALLGAWLAGSLNTLRDFAPALSHSILGALVGAIAGVEFYKASRGIQRSTGALFVGPFALGAVIGRLGCLFAGLPDRTYGSPTSLPWAVDLGDGVGRHPVQVYESLAMAGFLTVYLIALNSRAPWTLRRSFYVMCLWYACQRFGWEFLKPYRPLVGPLNLFHLLCLGLALYGLVFYLADRNREIAAATAGAQERALSVPWSDHQPV